MNKPLLLELKHNDFAMSSQPPALLIKPEDLPTQTFETIIDTRSPAEYAEDHIPGAINCPVLDDAQRSEIGTLYKQISPFEARKRGAILTARNIAKAIEENFLDKPKNWRPLIYCWRGGQRSGSMQIIFREIGWNAVRLEGGYKAYRTFVLQQLETLPQQFRYTVVNGPTGSGKTRLLHALSRAGAQVLDLEAMAGHKGSVLGLAPGSCQPSRKKFDTDLVAALQGMNPAQPVFVEAESKRIGNIHLPDALFAGIHTGSVLHLSVPLTERVRFLLEDYRYFIENPDALKERLQTLKGIQSNETLAAWTTRIDSGDWPGLVKDLLTQHYDPQYAAATRRHFGEQRTRKEIPVPRLDPDSLAKTAQQLLAQAF